MSKAKLIAVSGICGAGATLCLFLAGLPALKWVALILAVVASVCVTVPMLIDGKGLVYSLLTYFAASVIGVFLGMANIVYVAPIVAFCMPFAIVKVRGESVKLSAEFKQGETLSDPFGGEDKQVVEVNVNSKTHLPKVVKWILYYVLLEAAIALTLLVAYLFMPSTFEVIVNNKFFVWVLIAAQLVVIPYDLLLRGCLIATTKILRKAIKPQ